MKYYYYKGVELPDINTVWTDKETYPYAFIYKSNTSSDYLLTICAYRPVFTDDRGLQTRNVFKRYVKADFNDFWGFGYERNDPNETYNTGLNAQFVWTNSDILYDGRGTIYLAASKPISDGQYGMIPLVHYEAACDAIRSKNGKTGLIKSGEFESEIKKPSQFRKKLIERTLDGDLKKEDLEGVTKIGYRAFTNCKIDSADVPDTVISIGSGAFSDCFSLKKVVLPNGVEQILSSAFVNCHELTEINIPNALWYMDHSVFQGCKSLQNFLFPTGISSIPANTFYGCTALSNIAIPNTIRNIELLAFRGCTALTTIDLPISIDGISERAFESCTNLTTINVAWSEGDVAGAPWGATNATVVYGNQARDFNPVRKRDTAAGLVGESLDSILLNDGFYFPDGQAYAKLQKANNTLTVTAGDVIGLKGWIGFEKPILSFGVAIMQAGVGIANVVWEDFKQPTEGGVLAAGGQYASRYLIQIPTEGIEEPMTADVAWVALLEDDSIVIIHTVTVQVTVPETE